eukprot:842200-Pleurochrysis_carterae.AAC.1
MRDMLKVLRISRTGDCMSRKTWIEKNASHAGMVKPVREILVKTWISDASLRTRCARAVDEREKLPSLVRASTCGTHVEALACFEISVGVRGTYVQLPPRLAPIWQPQIPHMLRQTRKTHPSAMPRFWIAMSCPTSPTAHMNPERYAPRITLASGGGASSGCL